MLHQFLFPQQPHPLLTSSPHSPILSELSNPQDQPSFLASPLLTTSKKSHHRNWEAMEESIVEWFSRKQIERGEPLSLQQDFVRNQRRSIRHGQHSEGVSSGCNQLKRKLPRIVQISI